MSSYDEHLITQAGGDGDGLAQIQRRADAANNPPENNVGAVIIALQQSQSDVPALLALVREQQARLDASLALAAAWRLRYEQAPVGNDTIESALDDAAYELEDALNGTDYTKEPTP